MPRPDAINGDPLLGVDELLNHSGKSAKATIGLEKASQIATVVIAFVMIAVAIELGMLVSLIRGLRSDMKLDDPSNSPIASILGDGIQKGAYATMDGIDVLGIGALRNGTWTPALVESLFHVNWKAASDSLLHVDASVSKLYDTASGNPLDNPLKTSEEYQKFKAAVTLVGQKIPTIPWPAKPTGLPSTPNISSWFHANIETPGAPSLWKPIEAPCRATMKNVELVDWQNTTFTYLCDAGDPDSDCYIIPAHPCSNGDQCPDGTDCPSSNQCPAVPNPNFNPDCEKPQQGQNPHAVQCTQKLDIINAKKYGNSISSFCTSMATPGK